MYTPSRNGVVREFGRGSFRPAVAENQVPHQTTVSSTIARSRYFLKPIKVWIVRQFPMIGLLTSRIESFAETLGLVAPGGGLKQLDLSLDDTDYIFDAIFSARHENQDSGYDTSEHAGTNSETEHHPTSSVRVYSNDEDM